MRTRTHAAAASTRAAAAATRAVTSKAKCIGGGHGGEAGCCGGLQLVDGLSPGVLQLVDPPLVQRRQHVVAEIPEIRCPLQHRIPHFLLHAKHRQAVGAGSVAAVIYKTPVRRDLS